METISKLEYTMPRAIEFRVSKNNRFYKKNVGKLKEESKNLSFSFVGIKISCDELNGKDNIKSRKETKKEASLPDNLYCNTTESVHRETVSSWSTCEKQVDVFSDITTNKPEDKLQKKNVKKIARLFESEEDIVEAELYKQAERHLHRMKNKELILERQDKEKKHRDNIYGNKESFSSYYSLNHYLVEERNNEKQNRDYYLHAPIHVPIYYPLFHEPQQYSCLRSHSSNIYSRRSMSMFEMSTPFGNSADKMNLLHNLNDRLSLSAREPARRSGSNDSVENYANVIKELTGHPINEETDAQSILHNRNDENLSELEIFHIKNNTPRELHENLQTKLRDRFRSIISELKSKKNETS